MAVERQARAALAQQKAGGPPALASAVASPQFPKLQEGQQQQSLQPTLNLACPLCEMSFKSSKGLTAHLVQHYLPMIEGRYQSVMNACPYCEFQHNSRPHLLHHIVVNHKKLADFVPVEVRQLLKGSGVFDPVPGINGQQQVISINRRVAS